MTKILATLGPASLTPATIQRLDERGVDIFRINLSHAPFETLAETIELIRANTRKPICLDSEGAQVRNGYTEPGTVLVEGAKLRLTAQDLLSNAAVLSLRPASVLSGIRPNSLITVDFDSVLLRVLSIGGPDAEAEVLVGGTVGSNKAVNIFPPAPLPVFTEKDIASINLGLEMGIDHFALSFANAGADVAALRAMVGPAAFLMAKVESLRGVENLESIAAEADAVLIDRGDLSREVAIENIPLLQREIMRVVRAAGKQVYVATNLLESMVTSRTPTRAEVNDITSSLEAGADGLVLAAETAIGAYPVRAAEMVSAVARRFASASSGISRRDLAQAESLLLPGVYGGRSSRLPGVSVAEAAALPVVDIDEVGVADIAQFRAGLYQPLTGFMTRAETEHVFRRWTLPNGLKWSLPLVLPVSAAAAGNATAGARLALRDPATGGICAVLHVTERWETDASGFAARLFPAGGRSAELAAARGPILLAGPLALLDDRDDRVAALPQLSAEQVRTIFAMKGWTRAAAFEPAAAVDEGTVAHVRSAVNSFEGDGVLVRLGSDDAAAHEPWSARAIERHLSVATSNPWTPLDARTAGLLAIQARNSGCSHLILPPLFPPDERRALDQWLGGEIVELL